MRNVLTFFIILIIFVVCLYIAIQSLAEERNLFKTYFKVLIETYIPTYTSNDSNLKKLEEKNKVSLNALEAIKYLNVKNSDLDMLFYKEIPFEYNNTPFNITLFKAPFLKYKGNVLELGNSYIDSFQDTLLIAQENGLFFSVSSDFHEADLGIDFLKVPVEHLESNIIDFISYLEFFSMSKFGLKDILVADSKLYASIIIEKEPRCFTNSILVAQISNKLNFEEFFSINECINQYQSDEFNAHQSGGKMALLDENHIVFTTGDFRSRWLAQDSESYFGKILKINLIDAAVSVLAKGTRNAQGIYVDQENDKIWLTEHGPQGGDEINLLNLNDQNTNFGWPIASYGGHYGNSRIDKDGNLYEIRTREIYKKFPLYKSHQNYGFIEPVKYFVPSIGISDIIKINNSSKFSGNFYIVGAMGRPDNSTDQDMSLSFFKWEQNEIDDFQTIPIGERVRDFEIIKEKVFFTSESNALIGLLE